SPEVLAITVPPDPFLAGTLSGDMFLNSSFAFDGSTLFPILLHEAGHAFGLDHSTDPNSPMYSEFNQRTELTPGDISNLQDLYGARSPDAHEGHNGNDTFATATPIRYPRGRNTYRGETPLVVYGDITTNQDVDFFSVRTLDRYQGPVTLRLQ